MYFLSIEFQNTRFQDYKIDQNNNKKIMINRFKYLHFTQLRGLRNFHCLFTYTIHDFRISLQNRSNNKNKKINRFNIYISHSSEVYVIFTVYLHILPTISESHYTIDQNKKINGFKYLHITTKSIKFSISIYI